MLTDGDLSIKLLMAIAILKHVAPSHHYKTVHVIQSHLHSFSVVPLTVISCVTSWCIFTLAVSYTTDNASLSSSLAQKKVPKLQFSW